MERLKISVIIPVYNKEKYLKNCLHSIVMQSYKNLEIIVIDDGSTDGGHLIYDYYKSIDNRIVIIKQKNAGLSEARNAGLNIASGDYISFVDADDKIGLNFYKSIQQFLENDVDVISCCFSRNLLHLNNNYIKYKKKKIITNDLLKYYFLTNVQVGIKVFKRQNISEIRFVPGTTSEDILYSFECYRKAKTLISLDEKFYFYNSEGESITRSGLKIKDNNCVESTKYIYDLCQTNYKQYLDYAKSDYLYAIFCIMNKWAIRGFEDYESEKYYEPIFKKYRNYLKKEKKTILLSPTISFINKIQIFFVMISLEKYNKFRKIFKC